MHCNKKLACGMLRKFAGSGFKPEPAKRTNRKTGFPLTNCGNDRLKTARLLRSARNDKKRMRGLCPLHSLTTPLPPLLRGTAKCKNLKIQKFIYCLQDGGQGCSPCRPACRRSAHSHARPSRCRASRRRVRHGRSRNSVL